MTSATEPRREQSQRSFTGFGLPAVYRVICQCNTESIKSGLFVIDSYLPLLVHHP